MSYDLVGASPIKLRDAQKFSDYINVTTIKSTRAELLSGKESTTQFFRWSGLINLTRKGRRSFHLTRGSLISNGAFQTRRDSSPKFDSHPTPREIFNFLQPCFAPKLSLSSDHDQLKLFRHSYHSDQTRGYISLYTRSKRHFIFQS